MRLVIGVILLVLGLLLSLVGVVFILVGLNANPPFNAGAFVVFGLVLAFGVGLSIVGVMLMRVAKPAGGVPGQVGNYVSNKSDFRQHGGKTYEVFFKPAVKGKKGSQSSLTVRLPLATPTTLQFNPETWYDRLCKRVGIARECETGDADFDDAVYVRGPSFEYAVQYLADGDKRAAVLAVMKAGFREVRLTGTSVEAVWQSFDPLKTDRPGLSERAAEQLFVLTANLPPDEYDGSPAASGLDFMFQSALWVFAVGFALVGVCSFIYPPVRVMSLLLLGLMGFVGVYFLFGWIAAVMLHGKSTSHDRWGRLMGWGLFLIGFGSFGAVAAVNALADSGPPDERTVVVSNKHFSTGRRGSKSYYVVVPAWDQPGQTLDFSVSSNEYNAVVPGRSTLQLTIGRGFLGIEWVKSKWVHP